MTEIDLSVRFSHIDGTSVKQLLHMLKDVEEEFYENKKIDHQIEWEQEGTVQIKIKKLEFGSETFDRNDLNEHKKVLWRIRC